MLNMANGIANIDLGNSKTGNSLTTELVQQLHDQIKNAINNESINTLIIRSSGKHFCTGFDLSDLDNETDASLLYRFVQIENLLCTIWNAPIKTIALGHGYVLGAGADIFTACDVRLAAENTTFSFPGAGFGLILGTRRLAAQIGSNQAMHWVNSGNKIDIDEAVQAGLVHEIIDPATVSIEPNSDHTNRSTFNVLRKITRPNNDDSDMALLVRSITNGSIKKRIIDYADKIRAKASKHQTQQ